MILIDQNTNNSKRFTKTLTRLVTYDPDIICLQEVYNNQLSLNKELFGDYIVLIPQNKDFRCNAFLTRYRPIESGEIYFSGVDIQQTQDDNISQKSAVLWADFEIDKAIIRIYNCHLYVHKLGFLERAAIIEKIISHSDPKQPTIILGDMNTTIPDMGYQRFLNYLIHQSKSPQLTEVGKFYSKNEKYYFSKIINDMGFKDALDINTNTWRLPYTPFEFFCRLKLDWLLYRNLIKPKTKILADTPTYLDHKTIVANIET